MRKQHFLLLLLISANALSQSPKQVDSLKKELTATSDDSTRIVLQKQLYLAYYDSLPKKAAEVTRNMISGSAASGYEEGLAQGHYLLGHHFITMIDYDSARYHLRKSMDIGMRMNRPEIILNALEWIANVHQKTGQIDSALYTVQMAFEIARKNPTIPPEKTARIKLNEGRIYHGKGDYEAAIDAYMKARDHLTEEDLALEGNIVGRIGNLYYILGQDAKAKEYILEARSIFEKSSDRNGYFSMENRLGTLAMASEDYEAAEQHFLKSYAHFKSVDGFIDMATAASNLGYTYLSLEKFEMAEKYFKESIALSEKYQQTSLLPYSVNGLGELYRLNRNYDAAVGAYKKAIEIALEEGTANYLQDSYSFIIKAYSESGDFKNAYTYQNEFTQLNDSLDKAASLARITEIEEKYQNEKQQQEIELLTSKSELDAQKARNQRIRMAGGLAILALASLTLFLLYRNKQKINRQLRQLEAAKSRFFANISHEFRTPLTLISGPVAHQLSKHELSPEDKTDLNLIQRNAERLLTLVNQILDLSKIEAGRRRLQVSKGDLGLFLKFLLEPFEYQASKKGITFKRELKISGLAWFDRDVLEKVVANLLSNALKYTEMDGEISFVAQSDKRTVRFKVTNTNCSLAEKDLRQLYERFYQKQHSNQGFGIGLSLVRELVTLSKGEIKAYKPNASNVCFEVELPITDQAFQKNEIIRGDATWNVGELKSLPEDDLVPGGDELHEDPSLPVLLVVDDNEDIRLFIKTLLKEDYLILQAENGEEGVQKAFEAIPDLIISDVMMPLKDGIYLSNTLKHDQRTSHIPIILLTAKSGEENELTGLKTGADAYMVKPFKEEKLRVTIDQLIATRAAIQEKFTKQLSLKPKGITLTSMDSRLIEKIKIILDHELTNPEFNSTSFSEQIGLSRMHLHRKLKALTGLSTSEFIRTQRLKLAAQLLKEGHDNISEIAYSVGFNQPAYFSTAFKQFFGHSPSSIVSKTARQIPSDNSN